MDDELDARRLAPRSEADREPVIGAGCRFEGLLAFRGSARIEGTLSGEVVASGRLRIGAQASVRARVEVDELIVAGRLEGDATARERIELLSGAEVSGSLRAPRLIIAGGSRVDGRCDVGPAAFPREGLQP